MSNGYYYDEEGNFVAIEDGKVVKYGSDRDKIKGKDFEYESNGYKVDIRDIGKNEHSLGILRKYYNSWIKRCQLMNEDKCYIQRDDGEKSKASNTIIKVLNDEVFKRVGLNEIFNVLFDHGFLAGGALTTAHKHRNEPENLINDIKDFDFFFESPTSKYAAERRLKKIIGTLKEEGVTVKDFYSTNATSYSIEWGKELKLIIQLVGVFTLPILDTLKTFDIIANKIAMFSENDKYYITRHENAYKHTTSKFIRVNESRYPLNSAMRILKYAKKGFYVPPFQMLAVVLQILDKLNFDSHSMMKAHIQGFDVQLSDGMFEKLVNGIIDERHLTVTDGRVETVADPDTETP